MKKTNYLTKAFHAFISIYGLIIAIYTVRFTVQQSYWEKFNEAWYNKPYVYAALIHFPSGSIMLFTGVFQFSTYLRQKYRKVHIWSGRIYILTGLLQSLSCWVLIPISKGGLYTRIPFTILNTLYSITLAVSLYYIVVNRKIKTHQENMTRNFAYGFFPATLRIMHHIVRLFTSDEYNVHVYSVICVAIVNVTVAELIIKYQRYQDLKVEKQGAIQQIDEDVENVENNNIKEEQKKNNNNKVEDTIEMSVQQFKHQKEIQSPVKI